MTPLVEVGGVVYPVKKDVHISGTDADFDAVISIAYIPFDLDQADAIGNLQKARNDARNNSIKVSVTPDEKGVVKYGAEGTVLPKGFKRDAIKANLLKIGIQP